MIIKAWSINEMPPRYLSETKNVCRFSEFKLLKFNIRYNKRAGVQKCFV